ncbi:cAMP-dependent protein kinase catalytic subunit [Fusarium solani]
MPSLGFLKKKRTREGNSDPASNPTSPVTPTSRSKSISKAFGSSLLPRTSRNSTSVPAAQTNTSAQQQQQQQQQPQHQPQQQPDGQAGTAPQSNPPSAPAQQTAAVSDAERQQTMNSVNVQQPPYVTGNAMHHDPQNLPSITNLINPPQQHQHDAQGNSYANNGQPNSQYLSTIEARSAQTVSPGTDPAVLQQQQQQAMPQPTMQPQQHEYQQQQAQPQQHQANHQQQPSNGSQMRVTKGKYSLGDFDILRTLGTGSFGRVHLVQSKHNQRFYAVKVLKKAQVVKMKQVEHTNDERRMLADVKHPFLITLWGTFQDTKNLYMVMDFVEGGELFSLLRKSGGKSCECDLKESLLTCSQAFPEPSCQVLRRRGDASVGVSALQERHLPRPETRKSAP